MAGLTDFRYPGDPQPYGVIEAGVPGSTLAEIERIAVSLHDGFSAYDRCCQCMNVAHAFEAALKSSGASVALLGGDPDSPGPRYESRLPASLVAGYRTDERVVLHFWVIIGARALVFDPTAHQFDIKGGVELERYVFEGMPFPVWRSDPERVGAALVAASVTPPSTLDRLFGRGMMR